MRLIKDLSADQLAGFAFTVFVHSGRNDTGAKLIYRCLELEKEHPLGLRNLSDFLAWRGSESVSAIVLQHILDQKLSKSSEEHKELEKLLFISKWSWGFIKHKSGKTQLSATDFEDFNDFTIDEEDYYYFVNRAIESAGSRSNVLTGAFNLIGLYGGIVFSPSIQQNHTPLDFLKFNDFTTNDKYSDFLNSSTESLVQTMDQLKK